MMDSGRAQGIPAGVIEILNRSGQVLQRVAYSGGELSVGRAYDNDIIVSDPYVCAHHLAITGKDGIVIARDLDSVNGTYIGRERDRVEEATLGDESLIHFGHSQMRFRKAQSPVAASWRDTSRHGLLAWFGKPWMLVATVMLALLAMTMDNLLDSGESMGAGELAGQLLYPLIGILVWAGFWSLINRIIFTQRQFSCPSRNYLCRHRGNAAVFPAHITRRVCVCLGPCGALVAAGRADHRAGICCICPPALCHPRQGVGAGSSCRVQWNFVVRYADCG